ncbi:hypothetical protein FA15DRAFT_674886 [Coprinopsis marcescibilis]|uniref:F-box domain-containing protein n=1 Tax=Coprinopsis marcescibilis TaxID=230819 RepID=A0A5C3KGM8_COPMA|nr:hypothetical protein FA15DRAFT_674886 [Coprinopsis marcescibilis]
MDNLPLELIRQIVAFLPRQEGGRRSLTSTSLVSSTLRTPCQEILFSHLILSNVPARPIRKQLPSQRILSLKETSPDIARYFKRLTIADSLRAECGWVSKDAALPKALHWITSMTGITSLTVASMRWNEYDSETKSAIIAFISSPLLISLTINSSPLELLSVPGPSLKDLTLYQCSPRASEISGSPRDWSQLRSLSFSGSPLGDSPFVDLNKFLLQSESVGVWTSLQDLQALVWLSEQERNAMDKFISKHGVGLKRLSLDFVRYRANNEHGTSRLDLSNSAALETLELAYRHKALQPPESNPIGGWRDWADWQDPLPFIFRTLETIQPNTSLRCLTIKIQNSNLCDLAIPSGYRRLNYDS